jgi:hypothetical protein
MERDRDLMERDIIDEVTRRLPGSHRRRGAISRELRSHIEAAQRDLELTGWRREDARREVIARLGDPTEIVEGFAEVYRPSRRNRIGLACLLATGLLLGAYGASGTRASAHATHPATPQVYTTSRAHHASHHR